MKNTWKSVFRMGGPGFSPTGPLRIFLPKSCLHRGHGYLLGVRCNQESVWCITAIVHSSLHKAQEFVRRSKSRMNVLGVWAPAESLLEQPPSRIREAWLQVTSDGDNDRPQIKLLGSPNGQSHILLVLYEPEALLSSYFMYELELRTDGDIIQTVLQSNNAHRKWVQKVVAKEKNVPVWTDFVRQSNGFIVRSIERCNTIFSISLLWLFKLVQLFMIDNRWVSVR